MSHLFNRIFHRKSHSGRTDTMKDSACVIVTDTIGSIDVQRARIELLISECRKLDIVDIFIVNSDNVQIWPNSRSIGTKKLPHDILRDRMESHRTVILFSSQYHVSHEWIRTLLDLSIAEGKSQAPDSNKTTLCGHLMLKPHFVVLSNMDAHKLAKQSSSVGFHAILSELGPAAAVSRANKVEVTADNVKSLYRQAALTSIPLTYIIETTNHCNYSCYMCPYHGVRQANLITYIKPGMEAHMPLATFRRLIDEISALKCDYDESTTKTIVPYNRGEFLLYPHWRDALSYIKEKGHGAYFSSNGSLWTDDDIKFIMDVHLDTLQLSIDGYSEDTHSEIRLNKEYGKIIRTLKEIMKERNDREINYPVIQLAHTINEKNYQQVQQYINHWISKVDALFLGPENFMEERNMNKRYKIEYIDIPKESNALRPPCNTLLINMWIQSNGECHLCIGSKKTIIGNINEVSVKEILASNVRQEIIKCHSEGEYENHVCKNCEHWFCAYWRNIENEQYVARLSPDTQYYTRKGDLEKWWL